MKLASHIASIARGSVAGINYSANQFSRILARSKPIPSQPHSMNQTLIRSEFSSFSNRWNLLDPDQREDWDNYASSLTYLGPLGSYSLPGRLVFISNLCFYHYLVRRGHSPYVDYLNAPTIPGFISLDLLNIHTPPSSDIGYRIAGFNPQSVWITLAIWNSRPFNPSRRRHSGPWKSDQIFGGTVTPNTAFSFDITGLIPDKQYFCIIRACSTYSPHRLSHQYFLNTIATVTPPGYVIPPLPPEVTP